MGKCEVQNYTKQKTNASRANDLIGFEGGWPKPMRGEPEAGPIEASRSVLVMFRVGLS